MTVQHGFAMASGLEIPALPSCHLWFMAHLLQGPHSIYRIKIHWQFCTFTKIFWICTLLLVGVPMICIFLRRNGAIITSEISPVVVFFFFFKSQLILLKKVIRGSWIQIMIFIRNIYYLIHFLKMHVWTQT